MITPMLSPRPLTLEEADELYRLRLAGLPDAAEPDDEELDDALDELFADVTARSSA